MIYVVTEGEYSDYGIVHVFGDKATAERHVEQWNALHPGCGASERRVEAHEVLLGQLPKLAVLYQAQWWSHSDDDVYVAGVVSEMDDNVGRLDHLDARRFDDGNVYFKCSSFDSEKATKIVSDARAKHLAEAAGL